MKTELPISPRDIVVLAANQSESAKSWITQDERGVFENMASDLWEEHQGKGSDDEVADAIALVIALRATETMLKSANGE